MGNSSKTALITGGAGFIGSHLAEALIQRGFHVIVIDDLSTGNLENLSQATRTGKLEFHLGTVLDRALIERLTARASIVYHLAAAVGVRLIVEQPVRTLETNVEGTRVVLNAALKHKTLLFIASTSEVYGKNTAVPFHEDDDSVLGSTAKARWGYAASKAMDEFFALAYWKEARQPVVIGRFFNTVGPRQTGRYGMVLPSFVTAALSDKPITVFGTGQQTRCFCHVSDTVRAVIKLTHTPSAVGEVFNLGSDQAITIENLAMRVKAMVKSHSPITYMSYEQAYESGFEDMMCRKPCLDKVRQHIGWRPKMNLEAIIESVVEFYRDKPDVQFEKVAAASESVA